MIQDVQKLPRLVGLSSLHIYIQYSWKVRGYIDCPFQKYGELQRQ